MKQIFSSNLASKFVASVFIMVTFGLTGCVDFADGSGVSVWAGGKWALLVITGVPALYFYFRAWQKSKSGWTQQIGDNKGRKESDERLPIHKINLFKYALALTLAFIVIYLGVTLTER